MPDQDPFSGTPRVKRRDRRTADLVHAEHSQPPQAKIGGSAADCTRSAGLEAKGQHAANPVRTGFIVYSQPFLNWYRVQLDGTGAVIGATMASECAHAPMGPRAGGVVPPHTPCVVWYPSGATTGIILAAYPLARTDPRKDCPDSVSQGSQSGTQREDVYTQPIQSLYRAGGMAPFGNGRPLDSTCLEWGRHCETGMAIHLDPWMTFVRAGETCGVWLHAWDDHMRLAGWNMDFQTAAHEVVARLDEGENRYYEGHSVYPWETLGMTQWGGRAHAEFSDADVQFEIAKGRYDLPDDGEDVQSVNRYQEYGGYLGQGRRRLVMIPAHAEATRKYSDDAKVNPDAGVFEEFVGLDGTYGLRSARQVLLAKYVLIPVPRERRLPEDQKDGDDGRRGNYKFSGAFGRAAEGGDAAAPDEHKVGGLAVDADDENADKAHLLGVAGVFDTLAYAFNWQQEHPFHYHKGDYVVPQESDQYRSGMPNVAQDKLEFASLAGSQHMPPPTPKNLAVDHRHAVDYYSRVAYCNLLPDGSVAIGDGYGAEITLSGGRIRLSAPGGIDLTPGTDLNVLAGRDVVLRARQNLDATAGAGDVRLKAERNLQVLGGNKDGGGVLIESKSPGFQADFDNKVGTAVGMGGIMLKAADSAVVAWAGQVYLRTGGDGLADGPITLDAGRGQGAVIMKGDVEGYARQGVAFYIGPDGDDSTVKAAYVFGPDGAVLGKNTLIGGPMCVLGDIEQDGFTVNRHGFYSIDGFPGGAAGKDGEYGRKFDESIAQCRKVVGETEDGGSNYHDAFFGEYVYADKGPGNDDLITRVGFSFRDDEKGTQYHATEFTLTEGRWQQMARLGTASDGGVAKWDDEPTVSYQGRDQLPFPGKANWTDKKTLLRLSKLTMFDAAEGRAADRPGPYEDPTLAASETVTPAEGFTVIG